MSHPSPVAGWIALTFGLGAWTLAVFAVGTLYLFEPTVLFPAFALLGALFLFLRVRHRGAVERFPDAAAPSKPFNPWDYGLIGLIVIPCLAALGGALTPEVRGDSIIYHISAALLFCVNKGHVEIPSSVLTYIPQNQQLLYALGLLLGSDSAAKLFHWTAGILLIAGTFSTARALGLDRRPALSAAALVALFPIWIYLSTATMIDLGVGNAILAGVYLVCPWQRDSVTMKNALAAGALFGFAIGSKYTAAVVGLVPCFAMAAIMARGNSRTIRQAAAGFAAAIIVFSPWAVRNAIWTGNPVAPTLMRLLGPFDVPESTLNWPDIQPGNPALFMNPVGLARHCWETFWSLGNFGYHLPLITLILGTVCAVGAWRNRCFPRPVLFLSGFVVLSFLLGAPLGAVRSDSRYIMAHIAIMAALSAYWGCALLVHFSDRSPYIRLLVPAALTSLLFIWINSTRHRFNALNESLVPVISTSARAAYVRERLKGYDANTALTAAGLKPGSRVLGAFYPAPVHYVLPGTPIRAELLIQDPSQIKTEAQMRDLKECGIQYLFGEISPETIQMTEPAGTFGGVQLYRIR